MRVGDSIMRARRHQQLLCVMEESEASLESARDLRISALPASPFRQRRKPRQIIGRAEPFQQKIAERRGGFADRHAGVTALFEQDNRKPKLMGNHRHTAATEAGADDGKIKLAFQLAPPQRAHWILSSITCRRFISRSRLYRAE